MLASALPPIGRLESGSAFGKMLLETNQHTTSIPIMAHSPVPPSQELIHLFDLVWILQQVQQAGIKILGVGHGISAREYAHGTESKANLDNDYQMTLNDEQTTTWVAM